MAAHLGGGRTPTVAVIVSTYQRRDLIGAQIEALVTQAGVDHEVVVVDNGSTDGTPAVLADLARQHPRLRVLRLEDNRGPARARNLGWRATDAPWIAFTDDDCIAATGWLEQLVAATGAANLVQGRTLPLPADHHHLGPWSKSQRITGPTDRFETCNLLIGRSLLEELDGFTESFTIASGEDTDLGWRALERGARFVFADEALVYHRVFPRSFIEFLRERPRWADVAAVIKRHPGSRRMLWARIFWRPAHAVVLVAAPALLLLGAVWSWWVVPTALVTWSAAYVVRSRHSGWSVSARLLRSAQTLVAAIWEVVVLTRASVRHRTLLL